MIEVMDKREIRSVATSNLTRELVPFLASLFIVLIALFAMHHQSSKKTEIEAMKRHEVDITRLSSSIIQSKTDSLLIDTIHRRRC